MSMFVVNLKTNPMKTLLLSIAFLYTVNVDAQNVNIPDANFKAYLVGSAAINTNMDTEIQVSEAVAFTGIIDCQSLNISDLIGIEAFTSIEVLICSNNSLTYLDVSQNTALTSLSSSNNNLTSLDVSQNTLLIGLGCGSNSLTSLDISSNTALTSLNCTFNQLECLNVSNGNNTNFSYFVVNFNSSLSCIEVDDVAYMQTNWSSNIDATASLSTDCDNDCSVSHLGTEVLNNTPKQLLKIVDLLGRETPYKQNTPLIYIFSDGTTERVFKLEE